MGVKILIPFCSSEKIDWNVSKLQDIQIYIFLNQQKNLLLHSTQIKIVIIILKENMFFFNANVSLDKDVFVYKTIVFAKKTGR